MDRIDINCDCGEGFGAWSMGDDEALLPHVTSANIACGAHAGDPDVMRRTLRLANALGLSAGAHPGYPDLQSFGRRPLAMTPEQIENSMLAQIGALAALARAEGVLLAHVKPHGALANQAAVTMELAAAIARAVAGFDQNLVLVALAGSALEHAGHAAGLRVAREAYVDRAYEPDGTLRARQHADALVQEPARCLEQALRIVREGYAQDYNGDRIPMTVETICLHGDLPGAPQRAAFLRAELARTGVRVQPLSTHS